MKKQSVLESFIPFIIMGIAVALVLGLLFLFFHLFIWGALIGAILWLIFFIKESFFPSKKSAGLKKGRIIEHQKKE
jgi:hypothetical protein